MPEIFKAYGYSFVFFSHDHEPMHIHVIGNDAKYIWNGEEFAFYEQHNIKSSDLKRIKKAIDERSSIIIKHWNKYFGKEENDENCEDLV